MGKTYGYWKPGAFATVVETGSGRVGYKMALEGAKRCTPNRPAVLVKCANGKWRDACLSEVYF